MKVIILAGGLGTRLSEYTEVTPKPMIKIGGKPLIWHIMKKYADFDHKSFYLALGYKSEVVKDYFLNYRALNSDFNIDLNSGLVTPQQIDNIDWKVTLIDTGEKTMTGGRVKRMQKIIGSETFMLTYGDGLANINLDKLLEFHRSHGKMITVTAVRPIARFGELKIDEYNSVTDFREKPQMNDGWINGGYFVIEPAFFDLIEGDSTLLEHEPLEKAVRAGELKAYRHEGFWHPMDTKRDLENLESLWIKEAPWAL
jgi:glucose-1-phosphate cytidylyltransferase